MASGRIHRAHPHTSCLTISPIFSFFFTIILSFFPPLPLPTLPAPPPPSPSSLLPLSSLSLLCKPPPLPLPHPHPHPHNADLSSLRHIRTRHKHPPCFLTFQNTYLGSEGWGGGGTHFLKNGSEGSGGWVRSRVCALRSIPPP